MSYSEIITLKLQLFY